MTLCLISTKITPRLLRLKQIISKVIGDSVSYAIIDKECQVDFREFDILYLCSPFDTKVQRNIAEQGKKLFIDIDPQYEVPPITSNPVVITVPYSDIIDLFVSSNITSEVIEGIVEIPCYKKVVKHPKNNQILVDFNYIKPEHIKKLPSEYDINGLAFGSVPTLTDFEGIVFNKGLICFELIDATLLGDSNYALFTHIEKNPDISIPDTMIDCALMGMKILVTDDLSMAKKFVLKHNCGIVIGREYLNKLPELLETSYPIKSIYETTYINNDVNKMAKLLKE